SVKNYPKELDDLERVLPLRRKSIPSPFATEAVACTMAMKLCLDLGLRRLKVERDSLTVCTFMHVWRSANGVAHQ
ncbi:hypothetical protein Golob_006430, partial [Gossypium lobatum]|nr:hypothetical protein [Gossypium lobatum]